MRRVLSLALACCAIGSGTAAAQATPASSRRVTFDTVVGTQDFFQSSGEWPTQVIVDAFASVAPRPGWQVSVRPVLWRVGGKWEALVDYLSVQYEFEKGSRWRVEAGRFPSSIGLGMTENRGNLNDGVIWCHRPYYMNLPSLGEDLPWVSLVSAVYPFGAQVSTSGDRWDARVGIVDRAPVEYWSGWQGASRGPNGVVGFGVTPRQGLRLGVSSAWGGYAQATADRPEQRYAMINAEGEYSAGNTKVSGEWTHDRFETPSGDRVAWGWTLQARQTLTPRLFVHSRASVVRSPQVDEAAAVTPRELRTVDTTIGYRVSPDLTARLAYSAVKDWRATAVDHQIGLSLMWARRWW